MLVKEGGFPALNGMGIVEGTFTCSPGDYDSVAVELLAVYISHPSGATFGTCPLKGMALSAETLSKLGDFLRGAEKDFEAILKREGVVDGGT